MYNHVKVRRASCFSNLLVMDSSKESPLKSPAHCATKVFPTLGGPNRRGRLKCPQLGQDVSAKDEKKVVVNCIQ